MRINKFVTMGELVHTKPRPFVVAGMTKLVAGLYLSQSCWSWLSIFRQ